MNKEEMFIKKNKKIIKGFSKKQLVKYRNIFIVLGLIVSSIGLMTSIIILLIGVLFLYVAYFYNKCINLKSNSILLAKEKNKDDNLNSDIIEQEKITKNRVNSVEKQKKEICFHVAGVTFKNSDGTSRQSIIRKIADEYVIEPYGGITNKEIKEIGIDRIYYYDDVPQLQEVVLKKNTYKDEQCINVFIVDSEKNELQIGNVPRECIKDVLAIMESGNIKKIYANILGGKYKETTYDIDTNKEKIVINNDCTLGVKINIELQ